MLRWNAVIDDPEAVVVAPAHAVEWSRPRVVSADHRLTRLLEQSLDDLRSLRLAEASAPGDTFLGAGVPWYLTLFGRDSLWAARMLLPLGTELAASTLRALARRAGHAVDPRDRRGAGQDHARAAPAPRRRSGHDLRLPAALLRHHRRHPAVDQPAARRVALGPARRGGGAPCCRTWRPRWAGSATRRPDGDGFVEYIDTSRPRPGQPGLEGLRTTPSGSATGGGRAAPIALVEVQGYAYEAALDGAALLDAFGRPGAATLARPTPTTWPSGSARGSGSTAPTGRSRRWPSTATGARVDALTSNIGHLLGTGLLDGRGGALVAALLASPDMADGFGLRTMSSPDGGVRPLSYHCGSVWPHDTAIVARGPGPRRVRRAGGASWPRGCSRRPRRSTAGCPSCSRGDARRRGRRPVPYPAACRPQAWSAAAAVTIMHAAVGLHPDVPAGRVLLRPLAGTPLGEVSVRGLRVAGKRSTSRSTGTARSA